MPYIDNWPNCPLCGTEHIRILRREGMNELYNIGTHGDPDGFACQITIKVGCRNVECEWKRSVTQIIPFQHQKDKDIWWHFHKVGYCKNDPELNLLYPRTNK